MAVLAVAAIFFSFNNSKAQPVFVNFDGDAIIKMGEDEYAPTNIRIKKGAKVTFVNEAESLRWPASDLHPSHLVYSAFDPKEGLAVGSSWEFTFDQVGEWGYHDHLAPYITGIISVTE